MPYQKWFCKIWSFLPRQVHAALIVVLTRGGSTARLVAKYRPNIPVLTVAVPVLTTDSLTWTCSGSLPITLPVYRMLEKCFYFFSTRARRVNILPI